MPLELEPAVLEGEQAASSSEDRYGKFLTCELCSHTCSCEMRSYSNFTFISLIDKIVPIHWCISKNAKDIKQEKTTFCVLSVWSIFCPLTKGDMIFFVLPGKTRSFIQVVFV